MNLTHDMIETQPGADDRASSSCWYRSAGWSRSCRCSFDKQATQPVEGIKPYPPLQLAGRDIYIREGCYNCHSQMIRPFRAETERYGHYSVAGEFVYDHPFLWGSQAHRTRPRAHRRALLRRLACASTSRTRATWCRSRTCRPIPWLARAPADAADIQAKMRALREIGVPYTDAEIAKAPEELKGKTEMDALIAYLQGLGTDLKPRAEVRTVPQGK